ncbi:hypothetical protein SISSUDRAFT_1118953 [Sistotremastrum suecicum HHB10207 ss-3]|uniref:Uncharacterized protein n=1 Tax=Sistotremastrum suecicum HHB10207 ss-3 TaxID=1314776 RepID=A0A166EBP5_9AGAM|nr:hypothetical protein SISSUDRAFT_1118953 [Sistotremastrum suecicum HHB10207 ss-3]
MAAIRLSFLTPFLIIALMQALNASAAPTSLVSEVHLRRQTPACGGPREMSCDVAQLDLNLDLDLEIPRPECGGPGEMSCDVSQAPLVLKERTPVPCGQAGGPSCDLCAQFPTTPGC